MTTTQPFDRSNTQGYTDADLAELNRRWVAAGGAEIADEDVAQHRQERPLAEYDLETRTGRYAITVQRHHYQGTLGVDDRERLLSHLRDGSEVPQFATRDEARRYIAEELESGAYYLGHGEYASPTYRVVAVGSERHRRLIPRQSQEDDMTSRTATRASTDKPVTYTTDGPVRGCCGHRHRSLAAAERCLGRDRRGCAEQGGYSDRRIVRAKSRG